MAITSTAPPRCASAPHSGHTRKGQVVPKRHANGRPAGGWFKIDNDVIERYGARLGAIGVAVYACLAYHSDRGGKSFPSYKCIAKELGISRRTAIKAVALLVHLGLVSVKKSEDREHANVYTILPIPQQGGEPAAPGVVQNIHQGGEPNALPGESVAPGVVNQMHPNNMLAGRTMQGCMLAITN